jgi:hypothetical protein
VKNGETFPVIASTHFHHGLLKFTFNLPDDPQIVKAIIFKPDSREDGVEGHRLVRVGEIKLEATSPAGAVK